jgi:hypothetical protein
MPEPLTIGLIGLDTSHVDAFTKLLNDPTDPHHVPGARVVAAYPGGSPDFDMSIGRVQKYTALVRDQFGVAILDTPEEVAQRVDLVMITAVDGRVHLEMLERTAPLGRPTFVDKPFALRSAEAQQMFELAEHHGVCLMSSSSLRYAEQLVEALADTSRGAIHGVDVSGPMALVATQPGWFWYGVHIAEIAMTAMGAGCVKVQAHTSDAHDTAVLQWGDGRMACLRGLRAGSAKFTAVLHRESGPQYLDLSVGRPAYATMIDAILSHLPHNRSAVPTEQTLEVIAILEGLNLSRASGDPADIATPATVA